ncbi:hypothetical protein GLAREA_09301 [Glarea lozoyensis ATCC 20868]|uniref:Uncharacterized protein n=1 Tax=Glarea lozoyensis (strain ATCC 20868 / MF5171) TaxID=1116229 RepID=S3EG29_GLAL2|nr:uncharacterized protein GLAREA_09301 [Glarea lozoyensis ATCC 20868]EPE37138.1 hypothetical protein GLAREA_09301 [Glarea lozoyensis ATCC 20868]
MQTITRGDADKAKGMFHMQLLSVKPGAATSKVEVNTDIDVKEQFLIHAYTDLVDFINDFQMTRSGKPTKRMLSKIHNWNPNLDLQKASKEERIEWRRSYTVNWLYDLVNQFSAIVVQRNTMKGENHDLAKVDWSTTGPWNKHRRLFGLVEFAGHITSLAMQKPGTDFRKSIQPHHVFQIQCIVDSFTISRGWYNNVLRGHVLSPPNKAFRLRRDVDLFLDRENERIGHGYLQAVDILRQVLKKDAMLNGDPKRYELVDATLEDLNIDFINWLGESMYISGLTDIPPSRFSNSNTNGVQEYSPYLCGVGLMEGLELAYGLNFLIWDRMPEPFSLIHLHNMLVKTGYIEEEVGLYATIQSLFLTTFFANGDIPTDNFDDAFISAMGETGSRRSLFQRRAIRRGISRTSTDMHGIVSLNANRFFKEKSLLRLLRESNWLPERITDEEIPVISLMGAHRLAQVKSSKDPKTGKNILEDSPLVARAKAQGMPEDVILSLSSVSEMLLNESEEDIPESLLPALPEGYTRGTLPKPKSADTLLSGTVLLDYLKRDIASDVSGTRPLSALNFTFITTIFMMHWDLIEKELRRLRNPLWVMAYETNKDMAKEKRVSFTVLLLADEDPECMQVIANVLTNPRYGVMQHVYWEDLDDPDDEEKLHQPFQFEEPACNVM